MIVSTKGRYALRVMVCLAQRATEDYVPLKEIAESENISQKYLESIMTVLSKASFVDAVHGKGGGYRLNRKPEDYTIGSILKLTEGRPSNIPAWRILQKEEPGALQSIGLRRVGLSH